LNQIESTEEELGNLKADNALLERQLQTYVDLDHIYDVAVNELGMVHPSEDQVIYYSQVESEYVRQYDEIPR
jgi:cell division protein FtsB